MITTCDRRADGRLFELASKGVYVQVDNVGYLEYQPESARADNVAVLVKEGFGDWYPKNVGYNFFEPLAAALESICADDLGKDAFAAKIKRISIGSKRSWSSLQCKVEGSTLYLDADPSYGKTKEDCRDYHKQIQQVIENAL